jgi:hypothetical protein
VKGYQAFRNGILLALYICLVVPLILIAAPCSLLLVACVNAFNLLNKLVDK